MIPKLSELTPEQMRVMCAEFMGAQWFTDKFGVNILSPLKPYDTSLDAMAEAEATLTEDEHHAFRCKLWEFAAVEKTNSRYERRYFSSSPLQRLAAFLIAKGLAKP
jgi:hypothetical protein